jgi:hypothetical protein
LIDKVKIGCHVYDINLVECVNKYEPRKGEIEYMKQVIRIDNSMPEDSKFGTLIHEIVHGIDYFMDMDLTEEQVTKLGNGFAMVLRDNPNLIELVREE